MWKIRLCFICKLSILYCSYIYVYELVYLVWVNGMVGTGRVFVLVALALKVSAFLSVVPITSDSSIAFANVSSDSARRRCRML